MGGLSWVRMREKQEEGTKFGEEKLSKSSFFVSERERGAGGKGHGWVVMKLNRQKR